MCDKLKIVSMDTILSLSHVMGILILVHKVTA